MKRAQKFFIDMIESEAETFVMLDNDSIALDNYLLVSVVVLTQGYYQSRKSQPRSQSMPNFFQGLVD
jgi:hypothetical protein